MNDDRYGTSVRERMKESMGKPWHSYNRRVNDRQIDYFSMIIGVLVGILCISALTIGFWWPQ